VPTAALAEKTVSIPQLQEKVKNGNADDSDRAALAILLQDEGRLLDAIQLFGVQIDEDVKRLSGGQKIFPPACCAYADEKWVERLCEWMRACAPWLLAKATRSEVDRIAAWAAENRSRRRRFPALKLLIFPGQHHIRKASLIVCRIASQQ
jgi:hypothetical protein